MSKNGQVFIEREVYPQLLAWLREPEILALTGPRQSGKTTLLRALASYLEEEEGEKVVFIDFEDTNQLENFLLAPEKFIELHIREREKVYFLFDEFRYVEDGGKILKLLHDRFSQVKFIITGSSSLQIREIASFLVGRAVFFHLFPLSFGEFLSFKDRAIFSLWQDYHQLFWQFLKGERVVHLDEEKVLFQKQLEALFEEYLIFGGYPAVVLSDPEKKRARLYSLVETYIEKDIIKYLKIGNFLAFKTFVRVLAAQVGDLVNFSSLATDTKLNFREVKKFLSVLEQTFVAELIYPYHHNRISELKKMPKVYFYDLGLRNALLDDFRSLLSRSERGSLVENFVFQNLSYCSWNIPRSFWRTKQGAEVDFVLRLEGRVIPIEVKYQSLSKPQVPRSLLSFMRRNKIRRGVVLTRDYLDLVAVAKGRILFLPVYFV